MCIFSLFLLLLDCFSGYDVFSAVTAIEAMILVRVGY